MRHTICILLWISNAYAGWSQSADTAHKIFLSTEESLKTRTTPDWYDQAKFGVFIHWGLYSVPAWATPIGTPDKVTDWKFFYKNNPYAEWYLNSLRIPGSPTQQHHQKTYGANFDYYDFGKGFIAGLKKWNANIWADLFKAAGAQYVVLTTKHSDGFTLYPSAVPHPLMPKEKINAPRDLVKEVEVAVRKAGLKFGVYYSGGLDWSFVQSPITNIWPDLFEHMPKSVAYTAYADMQMYELIRRYKPDVLWNDITFPANGDLLGIFAALFNANRDAVVNDRWRRSLQLTDFETPEYVVLDSITQRKWETCRGIGYSFGYNQVENDQQYLSASELINMLVDIVSKNGNFLLNVGPMADGTIPPAQAQRILEMGRWLVVNAQAIYNTKPWVKAAAVTADSIQVRYTQNSNALFAVLLNRPKADAILLPDMILTGNTKIRLLGYGRDLVWRQDGKNVMLQFPADAKFKHAASLQIIPKPGIVK